MKGSRAVQAVEYAYACIWRRHPELPAPEAVLCLVELPSTRHAAWTQEPRRRNEQFVLSVTTGTLTAPRWAMSVILHEAAHLLCTVRGVKDLRADGRYHTRKFAEVSADLGLHTVMYGPAHGWASSTMSPDTTSRYSHAIERLAAL